MKSKTLKFLDLAIEYSIYGLIFFIPLSIAWISIFSSVAVVLFLIKQLLSPDFSSIKSNKVLFLILLIFFIFMALSLLNSGPLMKKSLTALFIKWGRFPLILWVILDTFRDIRRIVQAAGVFVFSAMLVGLSVFSQKFLGLEFFAHRLLVSGNVTGPFKNENGLAAYLTCVIPVVLSFSLCKWKQIAVKAGFFVLVIMLVLASFWTLCRGGWISLVCGLILIPLLINYSRLQKRMFLTLLSVGYGFCVPLIAVGLFFFGGRRDGERFILARGAWKMITEHPFFGKGVGTFMDYCSTYTNNFSPSYAHNCFLQMWAESGIFSLLSFLFLTGYVLYKSTKIILRTPASLNSFLLIGFTAGLLGFLVHSFFEVHLYSFQLSFLFWVIFGLTVALYSNLDQKQVSQAYWTVSRE